MLSMNYVFELDTPDIETYLTRGRIRPWFTPKIQLKPAKPKPLHIIGERDGTVCMELYNPVAPSSLIRIVWEFLRQNNINSNIKIIVHIYMAFIFYRRKLWTKPTCVFVYFLVCLVDSALNLTWGEAT